jgi:DNA polymerase
VESIHKGDPLRQKGKIAELALGYGGGTGAMINMGALKMGLKEDELQPIVDRWRASNPAITEFWKIVENAAKDAVNDKPTRIKHGISFVKKSGILFVRLPSGRSIAYVKPQMGTNKFGKTALTYMGLNQTSGKWERLETWGGKLTENIVQAFARDCLAESIIRLEDRGFEVNFHVHDEVILDVPKGISGAEEISAIMCETIEWAPELPLNADGYECDFYMKD